MSIVNMRVIRTVAAAPLRAPEYAVLSGRHLSFFESLLPSGSVVQSELAGYNTDWLGVYTGNSTLLLKPTSTAQVAEILKFCSSEKLAICPQSGNTGLVGGSVPVHDEILLQLGRLNTILGIDESSGIVRTDSGVVLETLNAYCESHNFIVPLDLAAKGSCLIGGNLSTAAGGIRFLRYGSLHGNVLGIEVVTGSGDIINSMNSHRKDNTGYDLKQLFIGSEGTLGVITKASILLAPKPQNRQAAFVACHSFGDVLELLRMTRDVLAEVLSAFEFMDRAAVEAVRGQTMGIPELFQEKYPFYVLIETSGSNEAHDREKFEALLEKAYSACAANAVLAQDNSQFIQFWRLREHVGPALSSLGFRFVYDISLPHAHFYRIVETLRQQLPSDVVMSGYGHVGDGNLHLSVVLKGEKRGSARVEELAKVVDPLVYEYVQQSKGSISAEHGIGQMKVDKLPISRSEIEINYMKELKSLFDPSHILNPYKVLPH